MRRRRQGCLPVRRLLRERCRYRRDPGDEFTFHEYIYRHLSDDLRETWDQINECQDLDNPRERVEALLANHGIRGRQHLFIHALVTSCFNVSKSLRLLSISWSTYTSWRENDPDFLDLVNEINWHKDNFFEQALVGRVAAGDTNAIIHVAKTKLRDRGYSEKLEIEVTGTVQHEHAVSIVDLTLPIEVRQAILTALREHKQREGLVPLGRNNVRELVEAG